MKNLYLDVETTGTDHKKHGIIEFGIIVEIDGQVTEELQIKTRPHPNDLIDKKALEINKTSIEEINTYQNSQETYIMIKDLFKKYVNPFDKKDKFFLYGYNVYFDSQFLRSFFTKHGDIYYGSWFWTPSIDIMTLIAEELKSERVKMENFKLGTVAKHLNLDFDKDSLHGALEDIKITKKIKEYLK